jgi:hypothetical protein
MHKTLFVFSAASQRSTFFEYERVDGYWWYLKSKRQDKRLALLGCGALCTEYKKRRAGEKAWDSGCWG